jgi:hypothetical protein
MHLHVFDTTADWPIAWLPVFSAEAFRLSVISAFSLLSTQLRGQLSIKQNNVHFSFAFLVLTLRYHRFRATACVARVTSDRHGKV